jgi:hypothetical protein
MIKIISGHSLEGGSTEILINLTNLFNENGYLELAVYKSVSKTVSSAHTLLGLKFRDTITIHFKN